MGGLLCKRFLWSAVVRTALLLIRFHSLFFLQLPLAAIQPSCLSSALIASAAVLSSQQPASSLKLLPLTLLLLFQRPTVT